MNDATLSKMNTELPKITIITVVRNNRHFVEEAVKSVLSQEYSNLEYIVIDGGSNDGTKETLMKYSKRISKIISEPDNGIYDAMNKGIRYATGEIIGLLNSDDLYADSTVLQTVARIMQGTRADSCYGDLLYVGRNNPDKVYRYWKSCPYKDNLFEKGWMVAHPTFFVKKWVYEKYGVFDLTLGIVADYEVAFRFIHEYRIKACYIPKVLIKMRWGGASNRSIGNYIRQNLMILKILKKNKARVSFLFVFYKIAEKIKQFIRKYQT